MTASGAVPLFDPATTLGRHYAEVDWAATPLGVPDSWPDSLKSTVRLMIGSRFAIWMAWGPELTFFCNDAYRRDTLGEKYPWALGRPASVVWSEIWDDVTERIEAVTVNGESTWDEGLQLFLERNGYTEETYHTFSYSPLTDDDAQVSGLFCVVSEDTGRVISERRITSMRDLAAGLADTTGEVQVIAAAARDLANNPMDLPFVAGYLLDDAGDAAHRVWTTGIDEAHPAVPSTIDLADRRSPWSSALHDDGTVGIVDGLDDRFADLPTGAWALPPTQGLVVPLSQPGERRLSGFLIVGANRHRLVDAEYLGFISLVSGQIAAALTRARAFDAERDRAAQMAELDRAKTTFFTNVSHELRTPLTLLLGPAEDELADETVIGSRRTRMEIIQRNGARLLKLVNTLLDFSRLESGQVSAQFEPVDLPRLTAELASMFESAYERAGLHLTVDCPPLPEVIHVDREMWAKIVLNLLSNALKATFTGGVDLTLRAKDGSVELRVTDTGIGISPAEQERLFERFHRVAGAQLRTHEGSGIGLALVHELVALHGGSIDVESAEGVGTTFTVTVRTGTAHLDADHMIAGGAADVRRLAQFGAGYVAEATRWTDAREEVAAAEPDGRPFVLVADDNADMRDYVGGLLGEHYAVATAADGQIALALARQRPPDLVLTDVMMPNLDGFGLLAALRADPTTLHIPVVMLSARSGEDAAVEGLEAGADDYLIKPFATRELLARVRANLELDRVRRIVAELERSRQLLDSAEQLARVGSFEVDVASGRVSGSAEYLRLMTGRPGQPSGTTLDGALTRLHPGDLARSEAALAHSLQSGEPLDIEVRIGTDSGARTVWVHGVVGHGDDGAPVTLRGSVQDITERKISERAQLAAAAATEVAAREHAIAQELQASLLPARTLDTDHLDIAGCYRAGVADTEVGGDWYDVIELDAGRTALVLGDVMGRGVRAAAVMGQLRATARAYARIELAPDTVLQLLDEAVHDIDPAMIVTCVYAIYDPSDQTLVYCNAGHLPPLLSVPGRPTRRLTVGGPPLGSARSWPAPETVHLPTGSTLTLYTDGLVEVRGSDIDDGIAQVTALLDSTDAPVQALPDMLVEHLRADGTDDDIAVLVARVSERSASERVEARTFDTDADDVVRQSRDFAAEYLQEWDVDEDTRFDVALIVSELMTNAIRHGSPPVGLRMRHTTDRLFLEVQDGAITAPRPRNALPSDDNGRGLLIVSRLAERWGTRPMPSGKSVWCLVRLPGEVA